MFFGSNSWTTYNTHENVFQHFNQNGYVTGAFYDLWEYYPIDWSSVYDDKPMFYSFDHYGSSFVWDPNYEIADGSRLTYSKGRNSFIERCLYGKSIQELNFEYMTQFWEAYPDVRKFFITDFNYAHESFGDLISYTDDSFVDFLQTFYERGYLKNTQVVFVSDHGAHYITGRIPVFPDDSRDIENAFPVLLHLTPRDIPAENLELLRENQQRFLTSHDIYAFLKSFAVGEVAGAPKMYDFSYFHESLPKGRDCKAKLCEDCYEPFFTNGWCYQDYSKVQSKKDERGYFYFQT